MTKRATTTPDEEPELLTVADVASLLRTTEEAVYCLSKRGLLAGKVKVGRRVLFRRVELRRSLGL